MITGVLLDLAGVIYEGERALPGAFDAVDRMRHAGLSLRFVTNTTRMTKHMVLQRLARLGFGVTERTVLRLTARTGTLYGHQHPFRSCASACSGHGWRRR